MWEWTYTRNAVLDLVSPSQVTRETRLQEGSLGCVWIMYSPTPNFGRGNGCGLNQTGVPSTAPLRRHFTCGLLRKMKVKTAVDFLFYLIYSVEL